MTVKEYAKKYGVSVRRVQYLIKQERIPAKKICGRYYINDELEYPVDNRYSAYCSRLRCMPRRQPVKENE